jgi:hypothetical protein
VVNRIWAYAAAADALVFGWALGTGVGPIGLIVPGIWTVFMVLLAEVDRD